MNHEYEKGCTVQPIPPNLLPLQFALSLVDGDCSKSCFPRFFLDVCQVSRVLTLFTYLDFGLIDT